MSAAYVSETIDSIRPQGDHLRVERSEASASEHHAASSPAPSTPFLSEAPSSVDLAKPEDDEPSAQDGSQLPSGDSPSDKEADGNSNKENKQGSEPSSSSQAGQKQAGGNKAFHQRNLAFIQKLAEQKKARDKEIDSMKLNWRESRAALGRSQSVLLRGESSRASLTSSSRRERGAGPGRALDIHSPPNEAEEESGRPERTSTSAGRALGSDKEGGNRGEAPSSSNGGANAKDGKYQDLYMIYIQQLAERKKKGREDEQNAQSRKQQNREKLKQKVLKQIQESRPRRPWENPSGAASESFRLPPLHGAPAPIAARRSLDDSAVQLSGGSAHSSSAAPTMRRSLGTQQLQAANLSPYLPPAMLTRMSTGNQLAVGGGVNLVDEASSSAARTSGAKSASSAANPVSGAVCSLDTCFSGQPEFGVWKAKWRIPEGVRVFSMGPVGKHSEGIKAGLLRRGWIESPQPGSPFFNLQWSIRCGDIDFKALRGEQVVNHFQVASCITTKVGLLNSLHELPWFDTLDPETFYPRGYDLFREDGRAEFAEDFKWTAAESLVKRVAEEGRLEGISAPALLVAVRVCESRVAFERDLVEEDLATHPDGSIRPQSRCNSRREARISQTQVQAPPPLPAVKGAAAPAATPTFYHFQVPESDWNMILAQPALRSPPPARAVGLGAVPSYPSTKEASPPPAPAAPAPAEEGEKKEGDREEGESLGLEMGPGVRSLVERCKAVSEEMEKRIPQTHINGFNNVWIVKPSGKSRGRGIRLFNQWGEMMRYIGPDSTEAKWIVQKYIERPMLAHRRRKFDFRQWVLVTDWNPITCFFYSEAYVRFAATDYDATDLGVFAHLSNNSIVKDYDGYKKKGEGEKDTSADRPPIQDYLMWSQEEFCEYLKTAYGSSAAWVDKIQPQMKAIVRATLRCATDMVRTRKNSVQLYGYDFMLDDQLGVWLLEINASPTMEASTPVTERLCADVQEDILRVIVDLPQYRAAKKAEKKLLKKAAKEAPKSPQKGGKSKADPAASEPSSSALPPIEPIPEGGSDEEEDEEDVNSVDGRDEQAPPSSSSEAQEAAAGGCAPQVTDGAAVAHSLAKAWRPPKPEFPEFDTGKWELLLRDKVEVKAPKYTGLNLELVGSAIGKPKKAKAGKEGGSVSAPTIPSAATGGEAQPSPGTMAAALSIVPAS